MAAFKDLTIRAKVILLTTLCSSLALLLCSTGFVLHDMINMRASKVQQILTQAEMLAFNSTAVLTFQNAAAAEDLLASLKLDPAVEVACLFDETQQPLAHYSRRKLASDMLPSMDMTSGHRFTEEGSLDLFLPIEDGGETVGTLYLQNNLSELHERLMNYLKIAAFMLVGSLAVSASLAMLLQRMISQPVVNLARTAMEITESDDYSIRVEPPSKDEIGDLYHSFNKMLSQVERSRNALRGAVANMSHEIRTPINAILGFTELLQKGADRGDEKERQDYLATIDSSGKHLLELINDVLDLSKIESGQMEFEQVICSPHHIIAEVASVLRVKAMEKHLRLDYQWCSLIPEFIRTDPGRLRQLLINVIGNSIKFTQMGGIHILARLSGDGAERLCIDVIDSGIGIPPDRLNAVFEPFVQADNSVTRRFGGTGLGLPISRKIAIALGGNVEVHSEPGKGSTFTVTIETGSLDGVRLIEPGGADVNLPPISKSPVSTVERLPNCRVLVVDDGDTNRKLMRLLLARSGATVVLAENGRIGYELAMQQQFDVILMDMQMPVMDGYTATAKLRQEGVRIPIIALTAHAMSGDEKKCRDAGCSGYLTKPINGAVLLKTLFDTLAAVLPSPTIRRDNNAATAEVDTHELSSNPSDDDAAPIYSDLPTDDPEFLEIVAEFIDRLRSRKHELRAAWHARDFTLLGELAHWLKGSCGTAGFPEFTAPAKQLEQFAKQQELSAIEEMVARIEQLIDRTAVRAADTRLADS